MDKKWNYLIISLIKKDLKAFILEIAFIKILFYNYKLYFLEEFFRFHGNSSIVLEKEMISIFNSIKDRYLLNDLERKYLLEHKKKSVNWYAKVGSRMDISNKILQEAYNYPADLHYLGKKKKLSLYKYKETELSYKKMLKKLKKHLKTDLLTNKDKISGIDDPEEFSNIIHYHISQKAFIKNIVTRMCTNKDHFYSYKKDFLKKIYLFKDSKDSSSEKELLSIFDSIKHTYRYNDYERKHLLKNTDLSLDTESAYKTMLEGFEEIYRNK